MPTCVAITNLTKRYRKTLAVDRLNLEISVGEVFGFLGPNGAGKSTTLHMLSGVLAPTAGTITLFGKDPRRNHLEISRRRGALSEQPAFYEHLSVENNLRIQARLAGIPVSVNRALDRVGILHLADSQPASLSHGMRKRLALALAMLTEPELLLLDEPTSGLDAESTQDIRQLLRRLADEARVTILIASHQLREIETLCHRVAILNRGQLLSCEKTDALLSYDLRKLQVILEGPDSAARKLAELRWVESVEVKAGKLHVQLVDPAPHQLTAFLVNAGYQVSAIIPRRRTLQDYFLKVLSPDDVVRDAQDK
jgi:ABC-2 type transport system ATP-binding protein